MISESGRISSKAEATLTSSVFSMSDFICAYNLQSLLLAGESKMVVQSGFLVLLQVFIAAADLCLTAPLWRAESCRDSHVIVGSTAASMTVRHPLGFPFGVPRNAPLRQSSLRSQNSLSPTLPSQQAQHLERSDLINRLCSSIAMLHSVRVLLLDVISPSPKAMQRIGRQSSAIRTQKSPRPRSPCGYSRENNCTAWSGL